MRWSGTLIALALLICAGAGCDDDDPLTPAAIDPTGEYTVTSTVVTNSCVENFTCDPICRLSWLAIFSETQPLYVGQYQDDLVVCPLGPNNESSIVDGTYDDGLFEYDSSSGIFISLPDPGCRLELSWTSTLGFTADGFTGDVLYELRVIDGDPAVCAAASGHYTSLPCATRYEMNAVRCEGCTPAECDPG